MEDIDYRTPRGLDRQLVRSLTAESAWVREHQHLFLIGPTRHREDLVGSRTGAEGLP